MNVDSRFAEASEPNAPAYVHPLFQRAALQQPRNNAPQSTPVDARLWGIELLRLLAAFGVIFRHVGLVVGNQTTAWGDALQVCFKFATPFFLVTALFFAARRETRRFALAGDASPIESWASFARVRANRILVPFACWAAIYIGARALQLWHAGDTRGLHNQFADPGELMLSGGAMMLYFLPLLWVGLLTLRTLSPLLVRQSAARLAALFVFGTAINFTLDISGNSYDLAASQAFTAFGQSLENLTGFAPNRFLPTHLGLAILAHATRALPLIALAFLLSRTQNTERAPRSVRIFGNTSRARLRTVQLLLLGALGWSLTLLHPFVSTSISTLSTLAGCGAFCAALLISSRPLPFKFPVGLGRLAFGTFLCHQFVLYALEMTIGRFVPKPAGPATLILLAVLAMAISLGITAFAARTQFGRRLFAVN